MAFQPFCAGIAVLDHEKGRLVTERVASREQTCTLKEIPKDMNCKVQYRETVLDMLRGMSEDPDAVEQLVEKFVQLAEGFALSQAVAFPFSDDDNALITNWDGVVKSTNLRTHTLLDSTELSNCDYITHSLLHPLVVSLLAYRMGGAISAANTFYAHRWKSSGESAPVLADFHAEGDTGNATDDHRVTLVWEEHEDRSTAVSGRHHTFTEHNATPRLLTPLLLFGQDSAASPTVIVYDSKNTALWYETENSEGIRNSIGLDFHVNTITDAELYVMGQCNPNNRGLDDLTLTQLITEFPIHSYTDHFNHLLFSGKSRETILSTLNSLEVPESNPPSHSVSSKSQLNQRYEDWSAENRRNTPADIRRYPDGFLLSGVYDHVDSFVDSVNLKMRLDLNLNIGMDMMPRTVVDEQREQARKRICGLSEDSIDKKLASYLGSLAQYPYTGGTLLSTAQLQAFAEIMKTTYLDLTSRGYTDGSFMLLALSSLSSALGKALNGPKEVDVTPEPWVTYGDLQIFRTRCLYLFWCADCLMRYLMKLREGKFMISRLTEGELDQLWHETVRMAELLLRNWVAWAFFVETLPTGGFTVRTTEKA